MFPGLVHLIGVRSTIKLIVVALFSLAAASVEAAHTQARLVLSVEMARPGDTVLAGIQLHMDPQWQDRKSTRLNSSHS